MCAVNYEDVSTCGGLPQNHRWDQVSRSKALYKSRYFFGTPMSRSSLKIRLAEFAKHKTVVLKLLNLQLWRFLYCLYILGVYNYYEILSPDQCVEVGWIVRHVAPLRPNRSVPNHTPTTLEESTIYLPKIPQRSAVPAIPRGREPPGVSQ